VSQTKANHELMWGRSWNLLNMWGNERFPETRAVRGFNYDIWLKCWGFGVLIV
jgi:hypothetical protein